MIFVQNHSIPLFTEFFTFSLHKARKKVKWSRVPNFSVIIIIISFSFGKKYNLGTAAGSIFHDFFSHFSSFSKQFQFKNKPSIDRSIDLSNLAMSSLINMSRRRSPRPSDLGSWDDDYRLDCLVMTEKNEGNCLFPSSKF